MQVRAKHLTALRALISEYKMGDGYWTGNPEEDAIIAVRNRNLRAAQELLEMARIEKLKEQK
jgi:hypothetical protein